MCREQRIEWSARYRGGSNFGVKKLCQKLQRLLIAACTIEEDEDRKTPNQYKKKKKNERKTQWTQKKLHGQFIRQAIGKASEDQWGWSRKGCLKRTTEALIMAAQEQAIRTNNIKTKIDKNQENSKCRICGKAEESVNHVLSKCSKLA